MNSFLKPLSLISIHWMRISGHVTFLLILVFIHAVALQDEFSRKEAKRIHDGFAFSRVQL